MFDMLEQREQRSMGDPMVLLRAGLAGLSAEDLDDSPAAVLSERLVGLLESAERLEAELVRVTARWRRRRGWEVDGSPSPTAWLTYRAPIAKPRARTLVKAARVVDDVPRMGEALAAGVITSPHVAALARVVSDRRRPLLAEHGDVLVKQAERLPVGEFNLLVRRWAASADDHLASDEHGDPQRSNVVHASASLNGWVEGTFSLDPLADTTLPGVLDHLAPPDPKDAPDGVRSLSQRRGDALADLASWYHQGAKPGANPPNLGVVVDVATLNGDTPELAQLRCDLEGVGPVTRATLERIACGATLTRIVMAGTSVVLDQGRRTRFATKAQARAVRIRDGGCVFPSCDRPARWCDVHHVDSWVPDGLTNLDNLVSLCTRHHTMVHTTQWMIAAKPDGTFTATHPARAPWHQHDAGGAADLGPATLQPRSRASGGSFHDRHSFPGRRRPVVGRTR